MKSTIKATMGCFFQSFINITILIVISIIIIVFAIECSFHVSPKDTFYVKELEYWSKDKIVSCKILKKKYHEYNYNTAVIQLNNEEYNKVLQGVMTDQFCRQDSIISFDKKTLQIAYKSKIEGEILFFRRDGGEKIIKVGFNPPNKIIYENNGWK